MNECRAGGKNVIPPSSALEMKQAEGPRVAIRREVTRTTSAVNEALIKTD